MLVTDVRSKRSIQVTVNDRGPFVDGRILDLSWAGANKLHFVDDGVIKCRLAVL